jgi:YVTN family beta-propeller protein
MKRYLAGVVVAVAMIGSQAMSAPPGLAAAGAQPRSPKVHTITVGSNPTAVAVSRAQTRGYVLNDGSVSVLNLITHRQVAEPKTGFHDQTAIGLVHSGRRAYIGTFDLSVMKVLDTKTLKITRRVRVGKGATAIVSARTHAGQFAYVAMFTAGGSDGRVAVVRTSNATVLKTIKLPAGGQSAAAAPGGKMIWVGSVQSGRIWVINTGSQKMVRAISVTKSGPVVSIAFANNGTRAWVSGLGGVSVVNVATGKVAAFVPITKIFPNVSNLNAGPIELNNSGTAALVVNSTSVDNPARGTVAVLNTRTLKVNAQIKVGTEPTDLAIDRARNTAYITNFQDDTVSYFKVPK